MQELFDEPSRKPLPQPTFADVAHAGQKGVFSVIPMFGGLASELLGVLSSPVAQRRDDWFVDLQRRLQELENRVEALKLNDLGNNEQFVSATLQATQVALRTHQSEKLEALKNAVVNVATGRAPQEDLQLIFLNLVDSFTPTHLAVLGDFNTKDHPNQPRFRQQQDLTDQVVRDLRDRGLLRDTRLLAARGREDDPEALVIYDWEVTNLGKQFLSFITAPGPIG